MNANEAKAKALNDAYTSAYTEHLFRGAPEPNPADYNMRHGWVSVGDECYPASQWYPDNQPILD